MRKNISPPWGLVRVLVCAFILSVIFSGALIAQEGDPAEPDPVNPVIPYFEIPSLQQDEPGDEPVLVEPVTIPSDNPIVIPATEAGLYPVIVRLRPNTGYVSENQLSGIQAINSQRFAIQSTQEGILDTLSSVDAVTTNVHQFETIPYIAMHVDASGYAALEADPRVEAVIEDQVRELYTYYANQVVGAPDLWTAGFDGTGYAVAILDTGVDSSHPAFAGGKVIQEACYNTVTSGFKSVCPGGVEELVGPTAAQPNSCNGCYHGTHVAGIAAGDGGDISQFFGLASPTPHRGVAPGADIIAVNVFSVRTTNNTPGAFDSDVLAGLEYVYKLATDGPDGNPNTADAVKIASANMSLGGGRSYEVCDGSDDPGYFDIAAQLASANVATIAASGNNGYKDSIGFPSCYSNIIAVGATIVEQSSPSQLAGKDGQVADFSNSINFIDLLAPGQYIISSVPVGTGPGGGDWRSLSGTSMAAPYVAGSWAIMRQRFPNGTVADILAQLKLTGLETTDTANDVTTSRIRLVEASQLLEPTLIAPIDLLIADQPTFYWNDMPLTDQYDVRIYRKSDDNLEAVAANVHPCNTEGICSIGIGNTVILQNNTEYYWTVQGKAGAVTSPLANADFIVKTTSPTGSILTDTPDFVFPRTAGADITLYQLEVTNPALTGNKVIFQGWYAATDVCDVAVCSINPQINLAQVVGDLALEWRYRTYNGVTKVTSEPSATFKFTVLAPVVAGPTGTITKETGKPTYSIVELTIGTDSADWYRFYVIEDESGGVAYDGWMSVSEADSCIEGFCRFTPNVTLFNGDYTVYVNAYSDGKGYSAWSTPRKFTIDVPAPVIRDVKMLDIYEQAVGGMTTTSACARVSGKPTCTSPRPSFEFAYSQNGYSGEWIQVILWDESKQEIAYTETIFVSNPTGNNVQCEDTSTALTFSPGTCIVKLPSALNNGMYTWYIRTEGPGGFSTGGIQGYTQPGNANAGDPNNVATFVVNASQSPVTGLTATLHAGGLNNVPGMTFTGIPGEVRYTWNHVPTIEWYQLTVLDPEGDVRYEGWHQAGSEALPCDTVCTIFPDSWYENGTYKWEVIYWQGTLSQPGKASFVIDFDPVVLPNVSQLVVYNNETIDGNTRPRYEWDRMENATWYRLEVHDPEDVILYDEWFKAANVCNINVCTVWPDIHLVDGFHTWYVQPWGPAGLLTTGGPSNNGTAGPASFFMNNTNVSAPVPITPTRNQILGTSEPEFSWYPASHASWYQIQVFNLTSGDMFLDEWFYRPDWLCTTMVSGQPACTAAPGVPMPNGNNYTWSIRAYGPAGMGAWVNGVGSGGSFTISAPISKAPALIAPTYGTITPEDPVFKWEDVHAYWYRVEIKTILGKVLLSEWYPSDEIECAADVCSFTPEEDLLSGGAFVWSITTWSYGNGNTLSQSPQWVFVRL